MNIVDAPKTGTFQMRINPEVKKQVESLYAKCGMTLTDAVNAFFQQSLNVGGLPFLMNQNSEAVIRQQAIALLLAEQLSVSRQLRFCWQMSRLVRTA